LAHGGKLRRPHHGLGVIGRMHVGCDNAERAALQHTGDVVRRVRGHPYERRDAGFERRHADLAAGLEREARMLQVDIERVEASGRGDARDLGPAHQPHGHRGDHLVAGELLFDVVAQDVAYRHGVLSLYLVCLPWPYASGGAMLPGSETNGNHPMNYATDFKSIRGQVSAEEWQARVDLAACYRLVDKYGMTDLIYNHITARIPGSKDHLLI